MSDFHRYLTYASLFAAGATLTYVVNRRTQKIPSTTINNTCAGSKEDSSVVEVLVPQLETNVNDHVKKALQNVMEWNFDADLLNLESKGTAFFFLFFFLSSFSFSLFFFVC